MTAYPHIIDAYRLAWATREATDDSSLAVFRAEAEMVEGGTSEDEWAFYAGLWRRGVPPSKLAKELRRAGLGTAGGVVRGFVRLWRTAPREPRWMKERSSIELLGQDPENWGLPMTELPLASDDEERGWLVRACREVPLDDGERVHALDVWLDPVEDAGSCVVMLGRHGVGRTRVAPGTWAELRTLRARAVVAHGTLELDPSTTPDAATLHVQLPRNTVTE